MLEEGLTTKGGGWCWGGGGALEVDLEAADDEVFTLATGGWDERGGGVGTAGEARKIKRITVSFNHVHIGSSLQMFWRIGPMLA